MIKKFCDDIRKYFRYSIVSAKAQLKSEVANSYLNWLWWILQPFCFMLLYTFVFGGIFHAKESYFPIFIFIGISVWDFFNNTSKQAVKIIKNNKSIVSKVYLPKYILILTKIWVNGFKMLISFIIVVSMMVFYRVEISWHIFEFIPLLLTLGIFTFAFACFLLHYGVFVVDLANVLDIGLRCIFYLTGIFYNVSTRVPEPYGALLNTYNPVAFLMSSMRNVLIYQKGINWLVYLLWTLVSVLLAIIGIYKIYKNENSYVKVI